MAIHVIENWVCDCCGKIITGRDKNSQVRQDYLQIRGRLTWAVWDDELMRHVWVILNPRGQTEMLFCNLACLVAFAEARYKSDAARVVDIVKKQKQGMFVSEEEVRSAGGY